MDISVELSLPIVVKLSEVVSEISVIYQQCKPPPSTVYNVYNVYNVNDVYDVYDIFNVFNVFNVFYVFNVV